MVEVERKRGTAVLLVGMTPCPLTNSGLRADVGPVQQSGLGTTKLRPKKQLMMMQNERKWRSDLNQEEAQDR